MTKRRVKDLMVQFFSYLLLTMFIIFSLFPGIWMVLTSIKPIEEIFTSPPKIFTRNPILSNYTRVIFETNIPRAFLNSMVVAFFTILLTLFISIPAGYGLSRYRFKGSKTMSTAILFGYMLPAVVIITPLFMTFSKLKLIDTYTALIISNMTLTVPMSVLMLKSFFQTVPRELEEAAKIDGCTTLGALFRVVLPVVAPGIIAVMIFSFLQSWDEFLYALNFTNSESIRTLPIAIAQFSSQFTIDWGGMMGASVVISVPVLVIFMLFSKYFIKGLSEGAVKG